ncbi:type II toxin-antitoxin system VapB family antitoxin [Propioniciclava soli]|uniref:Type II toxin-antitoxin system VapB family antitoxin n=1 Tax=Propioniciclava soli TaxID=2775081 RepID=A0ABZ3C5T1_9ACTN
MHQLAQRAARVTGKSQTGAVEEALERLLRAYEVDPEGEDREARASAVRGIAAAYRYDVGYTNSEIRTVEDLYDDAGLPA